ncbi:SulP family inorganic anion transporter [Phytoactinopolyspora endophytica]|uniref:SulP family inorganic anion transporter n=1 Tax=Phytoactinopolyspora endophytica TaxID=1642495 RepID=UPI00101CBE6A|nr:SulP family inorganic anion transporter [Phytoactinopolyspora endophytica]
MGWNAWLSRFGRPTPKDAVSGFVAGLFSIPEGMAYAKLAGFNPVMGIYTGIVPTIVGSMFARTVLMVTTLTSAIALSSQSALTQAGLDPADQNQLATLVLMTGLVMLLFGVLRMGAAMSFVSNAVMTGFSVGIALQIITGSLGDATGYDSDVHNKLGQLLDTILNAGSWVPSAVGVAMATVAIWAICRSIRPLTAVAILVAMLAMTAVVGVAGPDVELAGDIAQIPAGLPAPVLPDLSVASDLVVGSVSIALVALAQAASISTAMPNPDGSRTSMNGDFGAQGAASIAGSLFQALPAGGSMSRTGVAAGAGATTRWAGIFAGVWLGLIVLTVGRYAELIPMPVIGALIVVIGAELLWERKTDIVLVLRTSWLSSLAMVVTFLATTQIPLQNAIVLGAVLSLLLYCTQAARQGRLTALVRDPDGGWRDVDPPRRIAPNTVTVLNYTGVSFFAEIYRLAEQWPDTSDARDAVIVLRLRALPDIASSALLKTLERYDSDLEQLGSRLLLVGVHPQFIRVLQRSGFAERLGEDGVFEERDTHFAAVEAAYAAAEEWLRRGPRESA